MNGLTEQERAIVKAVTDISNAICKKRGYHTTVKEADVGIILEAAGLLKQELSKRRKPCKKDTTVHSTSHSKTATGSAA